MSVIKFSESIEINCAHAFVFSYTQDYTKRLSWDTFLKKADLINGALAADKGVKAFCLAKNGMGMVTEYVTFSPPKVTAIKMTKGPYFFKSFSGSWRFKEITPQKTDVVFIYSFALRFPFSLFGYLVKLNLQANVRQRLRDLKNNVEAEIKPPHANPA